VRDASEEEIFPIQKTIMADKEIKVV